MDDATAPDGVVDTIGEAAALLSAVADPIRLGLLTQLCKGPACVCNLQTSPPVPDNLLSYHLRVLRDAGLVTSTRRGRWVDYSLTEGALTRLHAALPSETR
ncbi:winged helix-turn-helix transcriptional regulator [Trueperella pecoris]|uniref:Winged helix-turn-helix transcriptional regulator n=1 Tax=Trueperella pecoris TaxID=2733571 RepID=A0A7M1QZA3_9ACTO|nr:metalloregulator ArsR/SmtB family transcription factor [Trueperella pecoris]QOR47161.1 winged helix-turn-helix transcriptional regulator [Trueperella pecoris]